MVELSSTDILEIIALLGQEIESSRVISSAPSQRIIHVFLSGSQIINAIAISMTEN